MMSMMIGPEFISASSHALAKNHISKRHRKKYNRHPQENRVLHRQPPQPLKLNHDINVEELLIAPQIGEPYGAGLCSASRLRAAQRQ